MWVSKKASLVFLLGYCLFNLTMLCCCCRSCYSSFSERALEQRYPLQCINPTLHTTNLRCVFTLVRFHLPSFCCAASAAPAVPPRKRASRYFNNDDNHLRTHIIYHTVPPLLLLLLQCLSERVFKATTTIIAINTAPPSPGARTITNPNPNPTPPAGARAVPP